MGWFHTTFHNQIAEIWNFARSLDKPVHPTITWTSGIINAKGDLDDLQTHALALASSIIIQHDVVPKIIFGWDCPVTSSELSKSENLRRQLFPHLLMRSLDCEPTYYIDHRHLLLLRSPYSIAWPYSLGMGYRAKYLGAQASLTTHTIVSDIDTICVKPCIPYLESEIDIDPNTFCITNWYDDVNLSVGLCVYNTAKFRNIFWPLLTRCHWSSHRRDGTFIQHVRRTFPEYKDILDIRLMNRNKISTERFWKSRVRKNYWTEKTMHYHAWKGEARKDKDGFHDYYQSVLDSLMQKIYA